MYATSKAMVHHIYPPKVTRETIVETAMQTEVNFRNVSTRY